MFSIADLHKHFKQGCWSASPREETQVCRFWRWNALPGKLSWMISQHRVNDFRVLVQVSGGCFKPTACKFLPFYLSFHYLLYWTCRNIHMDWKWRNGMGFGRFLLMQIKEIHIQKCERLCTGIRMLQSKVYFKMEKTFAKTALSHNKLTVWHLTTHIWVVLHR